VVKMAGEQEQTRSCAAALAMPVMAQFESQVPGPLRDHLPPFLSPGRLTAPPVRVLLTVFIREDWFKGTTMQIQLTHVAGREGVLWQIREEQFVDNARTRDSNRALLFFRGVRGHNHTTRRTIGSHRDRWTIVETAHHLAFRALLELIGGQVQASLNQRMIEEVRVFPTHHEREACHIGEHCSIAVLPIEPEQCAFLWKLMSCQIPANGRKPLAQFFPVSPIAPGAETAEPTFSCAPVRPLCGS